MDVSKKLDNHTLQGLSDLTRLKSLDSLDEAASLKRLQNLDEFTGGGRVTRSADEVRASIHSQSGQGALNRRLAGGDNGPSPGSFDNGISCANSFTAGTLVRTDEGQKPIEDIEVGDKVLAEDPESGEQGYFEVVALTNHLEDEILEITIDPDGDDGDNILTASTEVLEVTAEHPLYVEDQGWRNAENLSIGDRLRRADGGMARVLAIERVALAEPEVVYNFTVKGPHTYFVLEVGVLVHNSKCAFDPDTNQWRATEKIDIDGMIYGPGDSMPYPPRVFGITEDMEAKMMAVLPEGNVYVGRSRPVGAAPFDNIVDAKQQWVDKWMITKSHPDGRRSLIDMQKLLDYDPINLKVRAYDNVYYIPRKWQPGGGKSINGKWQPGGGKWTEEGYMFGPQFVPMDRVRSYDQKYGLNGRDVVSDVDAAIYANRSGSLPDEVYLDDFGNPYNAQYHGPVDPRLFSISHGALYEGLKKPAVWKKLEAQGADRIPKLLAEDVIVFGNLPEIGKVGFIEVMSYGEAVEKYAKPWKWYRP